MTVATVIANCPHCLKIPLCRSWVNAVGVVESGGKAAELAAVNSAVGIPPGMYKPFKYFEIHDKEKT